MYRLFPCIPIFRGFFLLKVQKECVYVIMLKIALVLAKVYVLVGKKGISELSRWVAQKHTAHFYSFLYFFLHYNLLYIDSSLKFDNNEYKQKLPHF